VAAAGKAGAKKPKASKPEPAVRKKGAAPAKKGAAKARPPKKARPSRSPKKKK